MIEFKPSSVGRSEAEAQASRYLRDAVQRFKDDKRAIENCRKASDGTPIFTAVGETYPACGS